MLLVLDSFLKAIAAYEALLHRVQDASIMNQLDEVTQQGLRAGVIQHFEFTYELSWKFMKRWLAYNLGHTYVEGVTRKHLFRYAAEHLLINDVERWMEYHKARNLTTHTYDSDTVSEVFAAAEKFLSDAKSLYSALASRND